ncbi:MAG: hypothetical protein RIT45_3267 [Pseudomonadota bacterium]|jgi:glyoxylase-like metal-dependent hydrolase (beta-lactamase superfamily II)
MVSYDAPTSPRPRGPVERAEAAAAAAHGAEWVESGLLRLPLRTPTLPPATTTNHVLCGRDRAVIVDPSCPDAAGLDRTVALCRLLQEQAGWRWDAIVLTHHHRDHIAMAEPLARAMAIPIRCHAATVPLLPFVAQGDIEDDDVVAEVGHDVWRALHTPGHAPGHLALLRQGPDRPGAVIVGDLIAAEGTILIDPRDGDMALYLASLERVAAAEPRLAVPAHGGVLHDPITVLRGTAAHRLAREARVFEALGDTPRTDDALLPEAYGDTPRRLWPIALRSMRAHLLHLAAQGRAVQHAEGWVRAASTGA